MLRPHKQPSSAVVHRIPTGAALATLLAVLTGCGVFGLSEQERQDLARYQSNAQLYWDGGRLSQALDQIQKGLALAPDDYKLHTIRAWIYLRRSAGDPKLLAVAAKQFDKVMGLRSDSSQSGTARLGYAKTHSKIGLSKLDQVQEIDAALARNAIPASNVEVKKAEIQTLRSEARQEFDLAQAQLERMVADGEEVLLAHHDLMSILWWNGDYDGAVKHGVAYLDRLGELVNRLHKELERTLVVEYEQQVRSDLQRYTEDELQVRSFLANMHFKRGHYELAVEQLDRVLQRDPQRWSEYYNRGRALLELGRRDAAKRDFEKFVATTTLAADSDQVKLALRTLRDKQ